MGTTIRPELSEKNPYWIERHRYYELKHFCLQYPIWKKAYAALDGLSRRPSDLEVFSKKGEISDPTVRCVEARSYYIERMKTVEQAAIATDDPYNAKEFIERWSSENGPFGIEKVIQGAKTESVPLGELKKLSEERMLLFDEELMTFAMGNCIVMEDTNGNRKLLKKRYDAKIDAVAALMDAFVAFKLNRDAFE